MNKIAVAAFASLGVLALGTHACSSKETDDDPSSSDSNTSTNTTNTNVGGAQVSVGVNVGGSGGGEGGSCADVVVEANVEKLPADIIFVVDDSGSMSEEIQAIEQNINVNFANIIQSSGVDYQVIMVTEHGPDTWDVCVGPPLSATTNCAGPPVFVPGQFYHYDVNVQSWDSACKMFDTMFGPAGGGEPDQHGLCPNGWNAFLRPEAVKVFVEITDDQMGCDWDGASMYDNGQVAAGQQAALTFDNKLLQVNPGQFGTVADRNYIFYSIVGLPAKPNPLDPYTEFEAVVTGTCPTGVSPGTGYQWLSKGTGALRFPVCNYQSYDVVFQDIASGVVDVTSVPCEFEIPDPPAGKELDLNTIDVIYTPMGSGTPQEWTKVDSPSQCGPGKFYLDVPNDQIILCPQACDIVEADTEAKLEVKIECGFIET
jgi:hypothetical protein